MKYLSEGSGAFRFRGGSVKVHKDRENFESKCGKEPVRYFAYLEFFAEIIFKTAGVRGQCLYYTRTKPLENPVTEDNSFLCQEKSDELFVDTS